MLNVNPAVTQALENDHIYCHLYTFNFNGSTLRLTDAGRDIEYSGNTFLANGQILDVDDIKETSDVRVNELGITVTIADLALLAIMLQNNQFGRTIVIDRAYFDDVGAVIPDPIRLTTLRISGISTSTSPQGDSQMQIKVASDYADWERTAGRRTTDASQQDIYPGDKGLEFASQVRREQRWGGV